MERTFTPEELLEEYHRTGDQKYFDLWTEYVEAMRGRETYGWEGKAELFEQLGIPMGPEDELCHCECSHGPLGQSRTKPKAKARVKRPGKTFGRAKKKRR